jgi:hypothetical protein
VFALLPDGPVSRSLQSGQNHSAGSKPSTSCGEAIRRAKLIAELVEGFSSVPRFHVGQGFPHGFDVFLESLIDRVPDTSEIKALLGRERRSPVREQFRDEMVESFQFSSRVDGHVRILPVLQITHV